MNLEPLSEICNRTITGNRHLLLEVRFNDFLFIYKESVPLKRMKKDLMVFVEASLCHIAI